jgi:1-acyl-sn-glycerol-3-phosphate acyltransferase
MSKISQSTPKPISETLRPEITSLPQITMWRRLARNFLRALARFLFWLLARVQIEGLDLYPREGGALVVSNHLGDPDFVLGVAFAPRPMEFMVKSELYDYPLLGAILRAYGVIWVHRGQPDRRALRAAHEALMQGRVIGIAPEGRESLTGALEEGTHGAAYLALKADVPVVPVTFTGSENSRLLANLRRLRRTPMTVTIGAPFRLESSGNRKVDVEFGTETIMQKLARQLPSEYRGIFQKNLEAQDERR